MKRIRNVPGVLPEFEDVLVRWATLAAEEGLEMQISPVDESTVVVGIDGDLRLYRRAWNLAKKLGLVERGLQWAGEANRRLFYFAGGE